MTFYRCLFLSIIDENSPNNEFTLSVSQDKIKENQQRPCHFPKQFQEETCIFKVKFLYMMNIFTLWGNEVQENSQHENFFWVNWGQCIIHK